MNKETQHQQILELLKERKENGILSYERVKLAMIQMPVRILELKKMGYEIESLKVPGSRQVRYVLKEFLNEMPATDEGQGMLGITVERNYFNND